MENEKINVLLVDDDVDLCALLSEFLEGDGFSVHADVVNQNHTTQLSRFL
tara:strand:- start:409 stop:558 length:150 start_codon:yes stop_codon:yes gene_type:complete